MVLVVVEVVEVLVVLVVVEVVEVLVVVEVVLVDEVVEVVEVEERNLDHPFVVIDLHCHLAVLFLLEFLSCIYRNY